MLPLDEDGMDAIARERRRVGERIDPIDDLPPTVGEADNGQAQTRRRRPKPEAEQPEPAADAVSN